MSPTTWAWICLALPAAGCLFNAFFGRMLPAERTAGWVGTAAIALSFVAACEVAVGLGLIVALYRRRLPIDVDELRELQG